MPNLSIITASSLWAFLQVFARVSSLFISAPVFGDKAVPAQVKVGLAGLISLALLPLVRGTLMPGPIPALGPMLGDLLGQVMIGILIGFVVSLVFFAVRLGGSLLDYQMGFTQAATFDPQYNETITPVADFQYRYSLLIYLLINGHLLLLLALERSFVKLPASQLTLGGHALAVFSMLTGQMLINGIEIAAPGAAVLLITDVAFAFLSRAMPQMQVFYVGMPVKILVGLAVVLVALPLLTTVIGNEVLNSPITLGAAIHGMHR
jgi:flagellar biosynthetic protein FliR